MNKNIKLKRAAKFVLIICLIIVLTYLAYIPINLHVSKNQSLQLMANTKSKFPPADDREPTDPHSECREHLQGFASTGISCYLYYEQNYVNISSQNLTTSLEGVGFVETSSGNYAMFVNQKNPDEKISLDMEEIGESDNYNIKLIYSIRYGYSKCYVSCGFLPLIYR